MSVLGYVMALLNMHPLIKGGAVGLGLVPVFIGSALLVESIQDRLKRRKHMKTLLEQDKRLREEYNALYKQFREDSGSYYEATIKTEQHLANVKQQELNTKLDKYINAQVDEIDRAEGILTSLLKLK